MKLDTISLLLLVLTIAAAALWALYEVVLTKRTVPAANEVSKEPEWVEYARFVFAVCLIVLMIRVFDLAEVLLGLTVFTGIVWGGYRILNRSAQIKMVPTAEPVTTGTEPVQPIVRKEPVLVEFSRFLFPVVLVVLIVRSFVVEPFQIPSESMLPTLEKGDFILVNRFAYGLRFPVFNFKLLNLGDPQRGDVIVFRYPEDPSIDYIKRVVGLPGDKIRYGNKQLYINDQPIEKVLRGTYVKQPDKQEYLEKLGSVNHSILLQEYNYWPFHFLPENAEVTVPQHAYFAMGDNRDNSKDSREWGFVPDANLKGRAFFIWFSWENGLKWPRIGTRIK